MREIIIATHNKGKVKEFESLLGELGIKVMSLHDFPDINDIEETGETFAENAQLKAETIAKLFKKPVLADDSGLVVPSLNGEPGVYSARYAGEEANDERNIEKLLLNLEGYRKEERKAYFTCVLAFAVPNEKTLFFEGKCYGEIIDEARGNHGFGYDPIFVSEGYDETFAELDAHVKNEMSHRYHALMSFKENLLYAK